MNKFYTLSFSLFLFISSFAQVSKKSLLLGGNINYSRMELVELPEISEQKWFNFSVFAGKAIKENTVLGINLNVTPLNKSSYYSFTDTVTMRSKGFNAGPFLRRYKPLSKDLYLFVDLEANFGLYTSDIDNWPGNDDRKIKTWTSGLTVAPGISYKILKKLHAQAKIPDIFHIQYQEIKTNYKDAGIQDQTTEAFDLSSRLSNLVSLGSIVIGFYFEL